MRKRNRLRRALALLMTVLRLVTMSTGVLATEDAKTEIPEVTETPEFTKTPEATEPPEPTRTPEEKGHRKWQCTRFGRGTCSRGRCVKSGLYL